MPYKTRVRDMSYSRNSYRRKKEEFVSSLFHECTFSLSYRSGLSDWYLNIILNFFKKIKNLEVFARGVVTVSRGVLTEGPQVTVDRPRDGALLTLASGLPSLWRLKLLGSPRRHFPRAYLMRVSFSPLS